jgi:hypothetical protein
MVSRVAADKIRSGLEQALASIQQKLKGQRQ